MLGNVFLNFSIQFHFRTGDNPSLFLQLLYLQPGECLIMTIWEGWAHACYHRPSDFSMEPFLRVRLDYKRYSQVFVFFLGTCQPSMWYASKRFIKQLGGITFNCFEINKDFRLKDNTTSDVWAKKNEHLEAFWKNRKFLEHFFFNGSVSFFFWNSGTFFFLVIFFFNMRFELSIWTKHVN